RSPNFRLIAFRSRRAAPEAHHQLLNPTAMDLLLDPNIWIAFAMLTGLEIVLGIDNIIFISILVGRLPPAQRDSARRLGLGLAMVTRLLLLLSLSWVMG